MRTGHSDSCGTIELRSALASHVAIARGIECSPDQIIVTGGFRAGLAIALQAIGAKGKEAWVEDPSYPATRLALDLLALGQLPFRSMIRDSLSRVAAN
ncbi:aminotransferase class I/II-fold pyridoxal phosphate-dependent enzyme [Nitrobacteraceae bacterium UC4446_H13]